MKMVILYLISFLSFFNIANAQTVQQILKKSESYRNPGNSFEMEIQVQTKNQTQVFQVFLKGIDKTLIITKQPARDLGRNMLMLDRDFHAYIPNLKRSMKLSLSQKLSGQVSNGDISRTRWAGDYDGKIVGKKNGQIELMLKAQKENLTYEWIRLWVEEKSFKPLKAEYLGLNGKTLLKKAVFSDFKKILGAERVTTINITDPAGESSTMTILNMKSADFKDSFFTVRNMESFK